ncbi:MAG: hypothetical protein TECD_00543 [Hyphomicrobiaceae bacterium hypho_1]
MNISPFLSKHTILELLKEQSDHQSNLHTEHVAPKALTKRKNPIVDYGNFS